MLLNTHLYREKKTNSTAININKVAQVSIHSIHDACHHADQIYMHALGNNHIHIGVF